MVEKQVIGDCTLYLGDALDLLPLPGIFDAVLTSPPYDNLRTYDDSYIKFEWPELIHPIARSIKEGGVIVWNVADSVVAGSETGTSFKQALAFMDDGLQLHDTMLYAKRATNYPDVKRYDNAFEYVFIFSNGAPKTFNPIKDKRNAYAGTNMHGTDRLPNGETRQVANKGQLIPDYSKRLNWWLISHEQDCTEHPATMPRALADGHIQSWTNMGDIVLDPFMGSGTTGVACAKSGRKFVGIEINRKYFELACKRIEEAHRQPDMLVESEKATSNECA